jgi:hypothetical protein
MHDPLTDMHDMPLPIDHDITIMAIFDLQDIASHAVRRHRPDEVEASLLECGGIDAAVLVNKVTEQIVDLGTAHLVTRGGIGNDVNHTALQRTVSRERRGV